MNKTTLSGITVCYQTSNRLIIHTTKLIDTLFLLQSRGWRLRDMQPDDVTKSNGEVVEGELLYYYKE